MRYLRYAILAALAIVMVTVAIANRGPITLRLLPEELTGLFGFSWEITMPVFVVLLIAVMFGVVLGFVWEWIREHKYRRDAVVERRTRVELERELGSTGKSKKPGDDVLALLEGN
ncbi:MAG: LapA family protein [Boseongicola sp.]|nr:LapA family protein [Boseongicola sp.]